MRTYFVSFRPEVRMEENLPPFTSLELPQVRELVENAAGVLLPNYVTPWRYRSIVRYARSWFPHLDTRFEYCGKTRQILLFRKHGIRHPESLLFERPAHLVDHLAANDLPWHYPMVLKGDLGGGGSTVFPIYDPADFPGHLENLPCDKPLLIQRWVDHGGKDLRVVVYGERAISYFRVGGGRFYNNVCRGGKLDYGISPELQEKGIEAVRMFCRRTKIDVAGFDLMFPDDGDPVFVEINFHFGRKGLGGTSGHKMHMLQAISDWRNRCLESVREGV